MNILQKSNKHYVSNIDRFLAEFDRKHSPSAVQQAEINKYQRIYRLRDKITAAKKSLVEDRWKEFEED